MTEFAGASHKSAKDLKCTILHFQGLLNYTPTLETGQSVYSGNSAVVSSDESPAGTYASNLQDLSPYSGTPLVSYIPGYTATSYRPVTVYKPLLSTPMPEYEPLLPTPVPGYNYKPLLPTSVEEYEPLLPSPVPLYKPLLPTPVPVYKPLLPTPVVGYKPLLPNLVVGYKLLLPTPEPGYTPLLPTPVSGCKSLPTSVGEYKPLLPTPQVNWMSQVMCFALKNAVLFVLDCNITAPRVLLTAPHTFPVSCFILSSKVCHFGNKPLCSMFCKIYWVKKMSCFLK
jgi:hypothetical protein